ncbi:MAG: hypothetical protein BWY76_00325 [bacterium ADurb.Bin429]|nr:MAG: hypothetical protein BWY76_00325 [bacterium ADurb.Bin429]
MQRLLHTHAHWSTIFLLGILACGVLQAQAGTTIPRGFTADTVIVLTMEDDVLDRDAEAMGGSLCYITGTVSLASGQGTSQSNKIMLYGDRMEPRNAGEADWQMSPRPTNVYLAQGSTSLQHEFEYGPPCEPPPGETVWTQTYGYSAVGILITGGSTSGSDTLVVWSLLPTLLTTTIDDEDTY